MTRRTVRILLLLAASCVALLAFATPGMARSNGDRNHDRIPDRWERAHHLSLKVNQAKRDQDRDGLRNRAEFLAGTDPRQADSDDDGTDDGDESAGTITSFANGTLTIHLFTGEDVTGKVDDQTEIRCKQRDNGQLTARKASEGPGGGDDQGDDHGGQGRGGDDQGDDHGDGERGDGEHGDDHGRACAASDLTVGRVVGEAELKASSSGLVFREIELVS